MPPVPIVAVVGATAAGKSSLALDLAERLGGEIVNTDAFQVYRGMDIGTAKLPVAERRGIPHHLLDLVEITQPTTVSWFQELAKAVIADCRARGVVPVLVGGSALYTRSVVDVFEFPPTDPEIRAGYEARLEAEGPEALHRLLGELAPEAAAVMNPLNGRRLVRALEAIAVTGKPWSGTLPAPTYADPSTVQIGVDIDRPTLDARITERVDAMWADGLVEEVRSLAARGLREGVTASRAIGYPQVLAFLDGEISESRAREQIAAGTRRFARRQDGWFRKDGRISWVAYDDPDRIDKAVESVGAR
ncbi:tRNA (adenosine(37)-N6)-dimethylallyltransferase MiaA [Nocardioides marmoriginsengisoli]|uniref:tRNA dimethylallyltransferase n=1 Tax=Nocardioides marmoriginsengisoli TaxID=661483 RepID=A0A3N0CPP1_9ACTN|nr:tRNA (adenosine(37)-N6)-dimethylallyltransferase MiaA [Nocardioides marmoriginsengisoli]RNL65425.1 tRNA (adenosine(37)-N6)-dimethylallyltransferase MiaA [Nocardioides marmoriginsengisoli]